MWMCIQQQMLAAQGMKRIKGEHMQLGQGFVFGGGILYNLRYSKLNARDTGDDGDR
jgi:hypothetical protein